MYSGYAQAPVGFGQAPNIGGTGHGHGQRYQPPTNMPNSSATAPGGYGQALYIGGTDYSHVQTYQSQTNMPISSATVPVAYKQTPYIGGTGHDSGQIYQPPAIMPNSSATTPVANKQLPQLPCTSYGSGQTYQPPTKMPSSSATVPLVYKQPPCIAGRVHGSVQTSQPPRSMPDSSAAVPDASIAQVKEKLTVLVNVWTQHGQNLTLDSGKFGKLTVSVKVKLLLKAGSILALELAPDAMVEDLMGFCQTSAGMMFPKLTDIHGNRLHRGVKLESYLGETEKDLRARFLQLETGPNGGWSYMNEENWRKTLGHEDGEPLLFVNCSEDNITVFVDNALNGELLATVELPITKNGSVLLAELEAATGYDFDFKITVGDATLDTQASLLENSIHDQDHVLAVKEPREPPDQDWYDIAGSDM